MQRTQMLISSCLLNTSTYLDSFCGNHTFLILLTARVKRASSWQSEEDRRILPFLASKIIRNQSLQFWAVESVVFKTETRVGDVCLLQLQTRKMPTFFCAVMNTSLSDYSKKLDTLQNWVYFIFKDFYSNMLIVIISFSCMSNMIT